MVATSHYIRNPATSRLLLKLLNLYCKCIRILCTYGESQDEEQNLTGFFVSFEGASSADIESALASWDNGFDSSKYTPFEGYLNHDGSTPEDNGSTSSKNILVDVYYEN